MRNIHEMKLKADPFERIKKIISKQYVADLYDPLLIPKELREALRKNDKAVMRAYGFDIKTTTAESCVAKLMEMYQELVVR